MTKTLFGLHVPKCAGTSLLRMIENEVDPSQLYQCTSFHRNFIEGRPEFLEIRNHSRLKVIWGHFIHEEMLYFVEDPFLFTYLREPDERLKSQYRFLSGLWSSLGRKVPSADDWVRNLRRNPMSEFIVERFPTIAGSGDLFERCKNVLSAFDFVGFSERFSDTAPQLLHLIGVSSEEVRSNTTDPSTYDFNIPGQLTAVDKQVYDWACEQFSSGWPGKEKSRMVGIERVLEKQPDLKKLSSWLARHYIEEARNFGFLRQLERSSAWASAWNREIIDQIDMQADGFGAE